MSTEISKRTVVIDLDACLADYDGWDVHGDFPGPPRIDVVSGLMKLKQKSFVIGILTTRNTELVKKWIAKHGLNDLIDFVNDNPYQPEGCSHKPIAFCYIDDRAVRYDGTNMGDIVDGIVSGALEPWYKRKPKVS